MRAGGCPEPSRGTSVSYQRVTSVMSWAATEHYGSWNSVIKILSLSSPAETDSFSKKQGLCSLHSRLLPFSWFISLVFSLNWSLSQSLFHRLLFCPLSFFLCVLISWVQFIRLNAQAAPPSIFSSSAGLKTVTIKIKFIMIIFYQLFSHAMNLLWLFYYRTSKKNKKRFM